VKKYALTIFLATFACVWVLEMTERAAAQGKKAATPAAPPIIDKDRIREHVKYLSSDEMEGRGTGQRGGDLAADYIAKQFASYGLKPAGDNGTFYQNVPMVGVGTLPETKFSFSEAGGKSFEAKNLTEQREPDGNGGHRCANRFCRFWNQSAGVRLGRLQDGGPARQGSVAVRE